MAQKKSKEQDGFIDLATLIPHEKIRFVEQIENNQNLVTEVNIRGLKIRYFTSNRRLLWIAAGLEFIEPELLDFIDDIESNAVFYDIGASNGPFSIYAAMKGLEVVAIEPEAQNFALLEMNHFLNNQNIRHPIVSLNVAVSDNDDLGQVFCAAYEGGGHMKILDKPVKVQEEQPFKPVHIQAVQKYCLDNLILKFGLRIPECIKIDVDGSEDKLLKGARNTLKNTALQKIFIEIDNPETKNRRIVECICESGFQLKKSTQVQRYEGLYNCIFERV